VVEDAADDFLLNVAVDPSGAQRVPPLVRREVHRTAVLVADVAALQPAVERQPVGGGGDRGCAVEVLRWPGEQPCRVGQGVGDAALLLVDQLM